MWVTPDVHEHAGVGLGVRPEVLAATLRAHPAARFVVLVSPTYAGVCSDLPALVEVAHDVDVPVFVDEAWGPHLPFHPWLPTDALAAGADDDADAGLGEVREDVTALVVHDRADRHGQLERVAADPAAVVAHAGLAVAAGAVRRAVVAEQRGDLRVGDEDDVTAVTAVAAVGARKGLELLATDGHTAVAAVAC